jgi:DNA-binding transcriptional LysR family regulator
VWPISGSKKSKIKLILKTLGLLIRGVVMSTFDPDALECLAAIVEEGGFERAAVRLSITQSAVSQRLRSLEVQVGTVLIVRSRPLKATSAGRLLLKHALQMRLLRADLERDLKDLTPGATGNGRDEERISIAINADSIATWALPALSRLVHQGLAIEIITDDQEFTHDWLREGQVLGCVTIVCCQALPRRGDGAQLSRVSVHRLQSQGRTAGGVHCAQLQPKAGSAESTLRAQFSGPGACRVGGLGCQRLT